MPGLRPDVDPDGLQEFSVVFTDRSLNHMSQKFQAAMRDISATLRRVYGAQAVALVPGGGTCAMEAAPMGACSMWRKWARQPPGSAGG